MSKLKVIAVGFVVLAASVTVALTARPAEAQDGSPQTRDILYVIDNDDGSSKFLGAMADANICNIVKGWLNVYAELPPKSNITFVCRPSDVTRS